MAISTGAAFYCGFAVRHSLYRIHAHSSLTQTINFTNIEALKSIQPMLGLWLLASASCDSLIALSMIYIVSNGRI